MLKFAKTAVLLIAVWILFLTFGPSSMNPFGKVTQTSSRRAMDAFTLPPVSTGENWDLTAHRGQVILLNFWATWCPPCRKETPDLVEVHKEFASRGFSVIGVAMDDDPTSVVPAFVKEYGIPYPVLKPVAFPMADSIENLPTSLLIDRNGRIARRYTGAVTASVLRRDIETLLAE